MSVPITTGGGSLNVGAPVQLFDMTIVPGTFEGEYAVSSTGRFPVNVPMDQLETMPVHVILNWAAGLKK